MDAQNAELNQENKQMVWDFWQKLNHVGADHVPEVVHAAFHEDVDWNVSAPIDQATGRRGGNQPISGCPCFAPFRISSTNPMSSWAASTSGP